MPIAANHYLEAIADLPNGATQTFDGVTWQDYEDLLAELGPGYSVRIFYDEGRMEIMAPTPAHERAKNMLIALVYALSDELEIDLEPLGSTTFRSKVKAKASSRITVSMSSTSRRHFAWKRNSIRGAILLRTLSLK
jgi:Uma2 family endonuclease